VRANRSLLLAAVVLAAAPATARSAVPHTVQAGETLWTIASANNLTNRALAAYNGLQPEGQVILGSTIQIPTPPEAYAAMQRAGMVPATAPAAPAPVAAGAPAQAAAPAAVASSAPKPMGGYTVRWGDTLGGLAKVAGVPMTSIAAMNGLDPAGVLLAGTVIKLPTGSPAPPNASAPLPAQKVIPAAAPQPTAQRADAGLIHTVASRNGVSGSLAAAIAWQESGFNNGMVSSANARGVMQIMPGTWTFIQQNLSPRQLNAASAEDNVAAGVLYIKHLLAQTGGDESSAIAGYYQGLSSVRSRGMYDDTRQYVANVQALRGRFGG
jgi:soluble lytic murein transglycosylase-like protein